MAFKCSYQKMASLGLAKVVSNGSEHFVNQEGEQGSAFGILKPRGPEPQQAKEFRQFLAQLASLRCVSVSELMSQGYGINYHGEQCVLRFPSSDMKKLFEEMRKSRKHLSALVKPAKTRSMSQNNFVPRPAFSM